MARMDLTWKKMAIEKTRLYRTIICEILLTFFIYMVIFIQLSFQFHFILRLLMLKMKDEL